MSALWLEKEEVHMRAGIRFHMLQRHPRYTRELEVEIEVVIVD